MSASDILQTEFIKKSVIYQLPIVNGFFIVCEDYLGGEFMFALARHTYKSLGEARLNAVNFVAENIPEDLVVRFYTPDSWTVVESFDFVGYDDDGKPEVRKC